MSFDSIMTGLDEAVKISEGKSIGRKQKLTITPLCDFSNTEIREIRINLNLSQMAFSMLLGVSQKTIEAWEKGTNSPNGPARRIIAMIKEEPEIIEKHHLVCR
jgi:putative transcriptional regulator